MRRSVSVVAAAMLLFAQASWAQTASGPAASTLADPPAPEASDVELAQQLANPISSLISVPFQFNYDRGFAGGDGERYTLNVQPVIPFSISEDWNVISRTIVPIISQDGVIPGEGSQFGLGATVQSLFFSPKAPTNAGLTWGVGPVFLLPTATDGISTNQWGAGVTSIGLVQRGGWTIGGLANHIWSLSGDDDISSTFLQPFVNYTTSRATSFFLNTESTYDWENDQWSVPINFGANQLIDIGNRRVQLGGGLRYWADSSDFGPQDWGARINVVFLFPK